MKSKLLPCEYLEINNPNIQDVIKERHGNRYEWHSTDPGTFRLSTAKHVKFYSALVWKNGGWFHIFDGTGRLLFAQGSIFTGSFVLESYAEQGLYVRVGAANEICPAVTFSWMELDDQTQRIN